MDTFGVVDIDVVVDGGNEFSEGLVSIWISEVDLEGVVEGLLVAVLPWTALLRT